ncbi:hypothetical protein PSAC2689_190104 [Paraburkholderia sacchari]
MAAAVLGNSSWQLQVCIKSDVNGVSLPPNAIFVADSTGHQWGVSRIGSGCLPAVNGM